MLLFILNLAMADGGKSGSPGGGLIAMMPFVIICLIFYFLMIRPQQKKEKEHQEMLKSLKEGDNVLTTGGLYGTIMETSDDYLIIRIAPSEIKMKISRSAISGLLLEEKQKKEKKKKDSKN
ncbi:MAG: preprotein translocase subunit YajC [bacterium]|nr:preprotein translocase subunit YajC [bacterium]